MGWLYNQMALPETLFQAWNKVVSNDGMAAKMSYVKNFQPCSSLFFAGQTL